MSLDFLKRLLSSFVLIPVTIFFIIKGSFFFNFFISGCFLISCYEWTKMNKIFFYKVFGLIFLTLSFYSIYMLRNGFDHQLIYLFFVATVCVSTDIGGYFFGKIFKGPKLTKISPKKTYSGLIGSYFFSIASINIYLGYNQVELSSDIIVLVLLISTISQLGDILISYFKRMHKIKDTGKIIPGHGGLLDRIDGMIFAFPFSYLIFLNWTF